MGREAAAPALIVLVPVCLFLGAMFVSVDLSTVAFAQHFGHKPLAGFILGTYALGSATGGLTWLSTGIAVGVAAGSSVVGFVIDARGPRWGYVFAAGCGAACVLICLAGLGRLRERPGTPR